MLMLLTRIVNSTSSWSWDWLSPLTWLCDNVPQSLLQTQNINMLRNEKCPPSFFSTSRSVFKWTFFLGWASASSSAFNRCDCVNYTTPGYWHWMLDLWPLPAPLTNDEQDKQINSPPASPSFLCYINYSGEIKVVKDLLNYLNVKVILIPKIFIH